MDTFHPEVLGFDASTFASTGGKAYDDDPESHERCYMEYTDKEHTVSMTAEEMIREMRTNLAVFSDEMA